MGFKSVVERSLKPILRLMWVMNDRVITNAQKERRRARGGGRSTCAVAYSKLRPFCRSPLPSWELTLSRECTFHYRRKSYLHFTSLVRNKHAGRTDGWRHVKSQRLFPFSLVSSFFSSAAMMATRFPVPSTIPSRLPFLHQTFELWPCVHALSSV